MEDAAIVALYWARDEQALSETAAKFGAYCRKIADNILHSAHDAEECENDTWLAAWNSMPDNRPARLAPYLGRITRNLALDRFDKATAQKRGCGQSFAPLDELAECVAAPGSVEESFDAAETGRLISAFLRTLPEETRTIFLRRYWYCDATADIAARMTVIHADASDWLASLAPDDADAASLLRRADEAMYRAKRAGRDRVVEAGSTPDGEG